MNGLMQLVQLACSGLTTCKPSLAYPLHHLRNTAHSFIWLRLSMYFLNLARTYTVIYMHALCVAMTTTYSVCSFGNRKAGRFVTMAIVWNVFLTSYGNSTLPQYLVMAGKQLFSAAVYCCKLNFLYFSSLWDGLVHHWLSLHHVVGRSNYVHVQWLSIHKSDCMCSLWALPFVHANLLSLYPACVSYKCFDMATVQQYASNGHMHMGIRGCSPCIYGCCGCMMHFTVVIYLKYFHLPLWGGLLL